MGSGSPRPAAWCWSRWTFESRVLHDARLKGGLSTTHPLREDEIRAIKAWLVERARMKAPGRSFFLSEQRKPLHRSTVNLALRKFGEKAKLPVAVHPHMLRHGQEADKKGAVVGQNGGCGPLARVGRSD